MRAVLNGSRMALATSIVVALCCGVGFLAGAVYGTWYSSRDKVCADFGRGVPVCDYGFKPPPESFVR